MPLNKITYADQVKVTRRWFVPHFPARPDRPLEMSMAKKWREYMSYEDHHSCGWTTSLVAEILDGIPNGLNIRTARTAATFAVWCMTPNGLGFLDTVLRKIQAKNAGDSWDNSGSNEIAIKAWAMENKLSSFVVNPLGVFVRNEFRRPVYKRRPYPTLEDHRAVEQTLCFLMSKEGRKFLKEVLSDAGLPTRLPL